MRERIEEFLTHLAVERGCSPRTREAYRRDLSFFHGPLSREGIRAYFASLRTRRRCASGVARGAASLRSFLRFLGREDLLTHVTTPKQPRLLPHPLTREQAAGLLEAPGAGPLAGRDRALAELLYACGLRASEAAGLRRSDVRLEAGYVRCLGKGSKERVVPLGRPALEALAAYLAEDPSAPPDAPLFRSLRGGPLARQTVWRIVRKLARRAGLTRRVYPHAVRHSFATHLVENGADLRYVQEMLGHAKISTTQVYTRVDQARLKAVHRRHHPRG